MLKEAVEENTGEDLPSNGQDRYTSVVVAGLAVTFPLVDVDQGGIFQPLRDLSFTPHGLEELCQFLPQCRPSCFVHFPRGEHLVLALCPRKVA